MRKTTTNDISKYGPWNPDELAEYRVNLKRIELEKLDRQYEAFCSKNWSIPKIFQPGEFLKERGILA